LERGLIEHEVDHVYTGLYDGAPVPNQDEVEGWKWVDFFALKEDIRQNPAHYTVWFKMIMNHPQFSSILV
jgi:isopentenyl-diphosphate delta-isomerase